MARRRPTPPAVSRELAQLVRAQRMHATLQLGPATPVARPRPAPAGGAPAAPPARDSADQDRNPLRVGPPPVPHINQSLPDGAPSSYVDVGLCGPTCMAMIARAFGLGASLPDAELVMRLARIADAARGGGTDRIGLYRMARHLRLRSLDWNGEATFWMARQLQQGRYILAAGNPYVLPPFEKIEGFGAHFIVVDGLDEDGNFLMKNPWPDGVHTVPPRRMWQFLMTHSHPYQYAFWR